MVLKFASSLTLICLLAGSVRAQNSGPIRVWINGGALEQYRFQSDQTISLPSINNTMHWINI